MVWRKQYQNNKYRAQSTEYGGYVYHSKLEASQAQELDFRIKAKELKSWDRQVKFEFWLIKKGKNWILLGEKPDTAMQVIKLSTYYLDFVAHRKDGCREFIESKGIELPKWKQNWKMLEALYGDDEKIMLRVIK